MENTEARIQLQMSFLDVSDARANQLAASLRDALEEAHEDVEAKQQRIDDEHMDFGTTLAVIIGSAAVTAIAKGVQAWLERNQDAEVTVRTKDGTVIAKGLRGKQVVEIVEIVNRQN